MNKPKALRELLSRPGIVVTPGAYDALSARLIEHAGFEMVAVTGSGVAASRLGAPDLGLVTLSEMVDQVANIVRAVDVPVFADCETGFGGVLNVMRAVQSFERVGVAGLFIEDQTYPPRCGHFANKSVIPIDDMVLKIRAALKARENPDLMIMVRTDARAVEGLASALTRARAYAEAGAESLMVESPTTREEVAEVAETLADLGLPLKANMVEGGSTPLHTADELESLGYKFAHFPGACQKVALKAISNFLQELRTTGSVDSFYPSKMASLDERSELLGLQKYLDIEKNLMGELQAKEMLTAMH